MQNYKTAIVIVIRNDNIDSAVTMSATVTQLTVNCAPNTNHQTKLINWLEPQTLASISPNLKSKLSAIPPTPSTSSHPPFGLLPSLPPPPSTPFPFPFSPLCFNPLFLCISSFPCHCPVKNKGINLHPKQNFPLPCFYQADRMEAPRYKST